MLSVTGDRVSIGDWIYWIVTLVTTNNYDSFAELHTPKITVTSAHINFAQTSLAVAWWRLPKWDVLLPLGSRTFPGISYQLLTYHNCDSQPTRPQLKVTFMLLYTGGLPAIRSS
jgi:hypothetical protein